ncbi:MAG: TIGR01777 family oxidoreductase [Fimbriimonadaceae bacterium]|nr:TIGR01777 family oxidoreductase [Fimbriimonadaceae bacterium]
MSEEVSKGKIVIAGATGFLGRAIAKHLHASGYEVVALSRKYKPVAGAREVRWDGKTVGEWASELEGAAAVINLSGAPVAKRWTLAYRELIVSSRVDPTRAIGEAILACKTSPPVWINASAVGIYGDAGDQLQNEDSRLGDDFLAMTTIAWEKAATDFSLPATRLVQPRIGVVLGEGGGAFDLLLKLTRWFLGGHLGDGKQWLSWIHIDDLTGIVLWSLENPEIHGPINTVAPAPERNRDFMFELRRAARRPWSPPVPWFAVRLLEKLGGPTTEPAVASTRASAEKALQAGYRFQFPTLRQALEQLI